MKEIKVAMFGAGGFAGNYLNAIPLKKREAVRLIGAVDPFVKECALCPIYNTPDELFAVEQPDIVIVSTPIHLHAEQAIYAFEHGCHVVLEKPISATVESARQIMAARDKTGKLLSIGFQLCYDPVIRAVKADADAGLFGKPVSMKVLVLWPRDHSYYHRGTGWAGKKLDHAGRPIYDNVLSNATAHYLMNMLFMANSPVTSLECATYRANAIETFDTAVMKGLSTTGAQLLVVVSHAAGKESQQNPMFEYTYEKAVLRWGGKGQTAKNFTATFNDGTVKDYGEVKQEYGENLWNMVDAIRDGAALGCPAETALWHLQALEEMRRQQPESTPFPASWVQETEGLTWVPGLGKALNDCFDAGELPHWDLTAPELRP